MKSSKLMKALLSMFLVALLIVAAGCGGGSSSTGGSSGGSTSEGSTSTGDSGTQQPAAESSGEEMIIKFAHVTTADSPKGMAADRFKELMEEKTGGKVKVEVYPSSQLYGDADEMEALQLGNVQLIAPSVTKLVGLNPQFQIVDMPFLFRDRDAVLKFWDGELGRELMDSLEDKNIKGLAMWENGFKHFTSNKPIHTAADFEGQLFRTQSGRVLDAQFAALGAGNQVIPFGDTYTALQQGTIDGQENTYNNMDTQNYAEIQKYLLISEHGRIDYVVLANSNWYNGLPDDIKVALDEAMAEATEYERELAVELDEGSKQNLLNTNLEVLTLSSEEREKFVEKMEAVYKEFEDVLGKDLIEAVKGL